MRCTGTRRPVFISTWRLFTQCSWVSLPENPVFLHTKPSHELFLLSLVLELAGFCCAMCIRLTLSIEETHNDP